MKVTQIKVGTYFTGEIANSPSNVQGLFVKIDGEEDDDHVIVSLADPSCVWDSEYLEIRNYQKVSKVLIAYEYE